MGVAGGAGHSVNGVGDRHCSSPRFAFTLTCMALPLPAFVTPNKIAFDMYYRRLYRRRDGVCMTYLPSWRQRRRSCRCGWDRSQDWNPPYL